MGTIFASLAFKAFELLWTTYEKKHGSKQKKTDREIILENLLKKQQKLIEDAKVYCHQCEEKLKDAEIRTKAAEDRAREAERKLKATEQLVARLNWRDVSANPY